MVSSRPVTDVPIAQQLLDAVHRLEHAVDGTLRRMEALKDVIVQLRRVVAYSEDDRVSIGITETLEASRALVPTRPGKHMNRARREKTDPRIADALL